MNTTSSKMGLFGKKLKIEDYDLALSYCRVSAKKQETDGSGLDSQETRNGQLASYHGLKIEKVFRDTYSGGGDFMNRPDMRELIEYLDAHPYKKYVVIFDDLKRFARDTKFHFELRTALAARNALPLCSNFVFDDTPEGVFVETIQAAHNQLEREQNRRQVIEKQMACLERGYWPFRSPHGYTKNKAKMGKRDELNEQSIYIKELFEGFASGRFQQLIDGARYLKEVKIFGKPTAGKYIETIKHILTQPFYAGFIEFPKWEMERRKGIHEPLISLELFEAVQKKIKRPVNITKVRYDIHPDFPLRGCVDCALCHEKLTGAWSKGKNKKYPYYFCQNKKCPLKGLSIRKKDIEDKFNLLLQEMTTEDDVIELAKAVFIDAKENDEKLRATEIKNDEQRKKDCEAEIDTYAGLAGKAKVPSVIAQYEKKIEKLADELADLEAIRVAEYDYGVPYRTALDKTLGILKNPYETWVELDVYQQQKFFSFLFEENLSYERKEGYRTPKYTVLTRVLSQIEDTDTDIVDPTGLEPATPSLQMMCSTR